jgi:UDP-3-O-[3-hydroxymyristoyl] N-acetylglucosamine deacetylase/3-hydroxyacyl-[acyl-carrier-protein] dehydratase
MNNIYQKTLKESFTINGVGLHTGQNVKMTFLPAPSNHGFVFKRIDLPEQPTIKVDADNVFDTSRGTSLKQNNAEVRTIEHAMAALVGMQVDNALIEIDCIETPILDGSSRFYIEAIEKAGVEEQDAEKEFFEITTNITFRNEEKKVELIAIPADDFRISVMVDYDSNVLTNQHASLYDINEFSNEFSKCRTFVFLHELEYLINNNLVKGGDINNAIVFVDRLVEEDELNRLAKFFNRPEIKVREQGILNNVELHYNNEPARHKLLDLIGDLATVGMPIKGHIIAIRPGHQSNIEFAKLIKKQIKQERSVPQIDVHAKPIYDINDIKRMLPHRPPFLLVDKIMKMTDKSIVGLKNITMNEPFFVGHFPDEPVMPGVLQIEAMAQCGGILVLSTITDPENYATYFMKITDVKFRQKVVPGDTLIFQLDLLSPIRRGLCHMKGTAFVGNKVVMEAELLAQISKKQSE